MLMPSLLSVGAAGGAAVFTSDCFPSTASNCLGNCGVPVRAEWGVQWGAVDPLFFAGYHEARISFADPRENLCVPFR